MYLCWIWVMCLCLVVFGYVWSCWYVLSSLCCWLRQCWRRCVGCCAVVPVQKKNDVCNFKINVPRENLSTVLINSKNNKNLHHAFL